MTRILLQREHEKNKDLKETIAFLKTPPPPPSPPIPNTKLPELSQRLQLAPGCSVWLNVFGALFSFLKDVTLASNKETNINKNMHLITVVGHSMFMKTCPFSAGTMISKIRIWEKAWVHLFTMGKQQRKTEVWKYALDHEYDLPRSHDLLSKVRNKTSCRLGTKHGANYPVHAIISPRLQSLLKGNDPRGDKKNEKTNGQGEVVFLPQ